MVALSRGGELNSLGDVVGPNRMFFVALDDVADLFGYQTAESYNAVCKDRPNEVRARMAAVKAQVEAEAP